MKRSIGLRLLLGTTLAALIALALASVTTYALFRRSMLHEFDELLGAKARTLATLVELKGRRVALEFEEHNLSEFTRTNSPEYYLVLNESGDVLASNDDRHSWIQSAALAARIDPTYNFAVLPDGRPGRMVAFPFKPLRENSNTGNHEGEDDHNHDGHLDTTISDEPKLSHTLVLARDTRQFEGTLARLAWIQIATAVIATSTILWLNSWGVSSGLRPLTTLAQRVGLITEERLASRFEVNQMPMEIVPIANSLNNLLSRLESAFAREKTFSSDVAHELRTPVAGLIATIEVTLSRTRDAEDFRQSLVECLAITQNVHRLVESLIALARLESGRSVCTHSECSLDEAIREEWVRFAPVAEQKGISFKLTGDREVLVGFNNAQLRIVLSNVFDNATEYCPKGGQIDIAWSATGSKFVLRVANSAEQLTPAQLQNVFGRFWRGDASRTKTGAHVGLGLSLTKRIVEAYGATISACCENEQFVILLQGSSTD